MNLGFYSYLAAAAGFGFLLLLLLFSWRSSPQGRMLTLVTGATALWALAAARVSVEQVYLQQNLVYECLEVLRYLSWYLFLLKLLEPAAAGRSSVRGYRVRNLTLAISLAGVVLLAGIVVQLTDLAAGQQQWLVVMMALHVLLAVYGLLLVEQLFRNTSSRYRWAVKYLFLAAGIVFAYDFFMYADALLFRDLDIELWRARGFVVLLTVPMLALAAARNPDWSENLFVSRDIVLHATTVIGAGLYLLVMAVAGWYLREVGGTWGHMLQIVFLALALVLLVVVLFSAQYRTQLRVFLGKHFYRNKYDYRREWLQLTNDLNRLGGDEDHYAAVVRVIAQVVDARGGLMWLQDETGYFRLAATWEADALDCEIVADDALVRFLEQKRYVIDLHELETQADEYEGLEVPDCIRDIERGWLVVPLQAMQSLRGFIVLVNPLVARAMNWEDRDLLKTAAMQVTSYLTVIMTTEALAEARQFEAFNRISAFMVHDLKNIAAELDMVAKNARRHRDNAAFIDDAFDTVGNSAASIGRLLQQLRDRQVIAEKKVKVDVSALVADVIERRGGKIPVPRLLPGAADCRVLAERERLANVLKHLIDNACQATTDSGTVTISVSADENAHPTCSITISDDGHGMDEDFIKNRLFRPFDTTRGNAGMGIGMYESREFVRMLGGEIRVSSSPGEGTVIVVALPAV
jgi:putative PEP-CTERM system histidine kinase